MKRRGGAPDAWGVVARFKDAQGAWREVGETTRDAVVAAMGGGPHAAPPAGSSVRVIRPGQAARVDGPAELVLEDGAVVRVTDRLPRDLPPGYHELRSLDGTGAIHVIATPGRCALPAGLRAWGWAVQLYAARSRESWGIGDLADLRRLARWSRRRLGAGLLLVNPLAAATPVTPLQPSPYCPTSRRFRHPLYLRVEEVPGAGDARLDLEPIAARGRALNAGDRIDRDAAWALKREALERLWSRFPEDPAFDRYCAEQGPALADFATFCAVAERHGRDWRSWPPDLGQPTAPGIARFHAEHGRRVRFYQWLQWLVDVQLARASAEIPVMHDLPIGVDPGGADAWAWQDVLASEATVGAPPDIFNQLGQDWGLPPFIPHRLAAAGYRPFIETIRANLRHAGGLRIDHVMGLFRLWWIPKGRSPAEGAYVRYPADDLLAILALESQRAGASVVGEDLGTVEAGVRERLRRHRILSYRLVWFETARPSRFPRLTMAAVTTHDLPTVAGLWSGADLEAQRRLGLRPNVERTEAIRRRLRRATGLPDGAAVARVVEGAYRLLGQAPSVFVTATLEDACAVPDRPNMPGTVTEWPCWLLPLPRPLEALEQERLPAAIATALRRRPGGRGDGRARPRRRGSDGASPGRHAAARGRAGARPRPGRGSRRAR